MGLAIRVWQVVSSSFQDGQNPMYTSHVRTWCCSNYYPIHFPWAPLQTQLSHWDIIFSHPFPFCFIYVHIRHPLYWAICNPLSFSLKFFYIYMDPLWDAEPCLSLCFRVVQMKHQCIQMHLLGAWDYRPALYMNLVDNTEHCLHATVKMGYDMWSSAQHVLLHASMRALQFLCIYTSIFSIF